MLENFARMLALAILVTHFCAAKSDGAPLDNAGVIKLASAGVGDDVIVAAVKSAGEVRFDTSADGLLTLKKAGVSDRVLLAILERQRAPATSTPPLGKVTLLAGDAEVNLTASPVLLAHAPKDAKFSDKVRQGGTKLDAEVDRGQAAADASRRSGLGKTLRRLPVTLTAGGSDVVRPPSAGPVDPRNLRVRQFYFLEDGQVPEVSGAVMLRMPATYGGVDLDDYTPVLLKLTVYEKERARLIETRDIETRPAAINPDQTEPDIKILSTVRAEFPVAGRRDAGIVTITSGDLEPGYYAFLLRDSTGDAYAPYAFQFRVR